MEILLLACVLFLLAVLTLTVCGSNAPKDAPPRSRRSETAAAPKSTSATAAAPNAAPKPKQLNEKEKMIEAGLKTGRNAYPTVDDVKSDWSDEEKEKEKKKDDKPSKEDKSRLSKELKFNETKSKASEEPKKA